MASLLRIENNSPTLDRSGRARKPRGNGQADETVDAFRTRVSSEYDRSLSTLIECEIIPRLMVAHAPADGAMAHDPVPHDDVIGTADVVALVPLALQVEADALLAHVEAILARGVGIDAVMVHLLAPVARRLGEFWEQDRCDFVDVTMGLWRLQEVVHELAVRVPPVKRAGTAPRRALFATMPGDNHTFGTIVIEELFRSHGWSTDRICDAQTSDLLQRAAAEWFDIIGLTICYDYHIGALPSAIAGIRSVSRNPQVRVLVGGWVFCENPELAATVGADGTAPDAVLALALAGNLVDALGGGVEDSR